MTDAEKVALEGADVGDVGALAGLVSDENSQKAIKTLAAQKAHFKEQRDSERTVRLEKEVEINRLKDELAKVKPPEVTPPPKPSIEQPQSKLTLSEALRLRSKGYSDQEVLKLGEYADKLSVTIDEVLKDPFISAGIEAERTKAKSDSSTPPPSGAAITIGDKPINQLSDAEIKANYPEIARRAVEEGRRGSRGGA